MCVRASTVSADLIIVIIIIIMHRVIEQNGQLLTSLPKRTLKVTTCLHLEKSSQDETFIHGSPV